MVYVGNDDVLLIMIIKRSSDKPLKILYINVRSKTILITDYWKGYGFLKNLLHKRLIINRKRFFVDPNYREMNIRSIKSKWKHLKSKETNKYKNIRNFINMNF
ncbi:hypothetical protein SLOPH_1148 [Spraguea lophii 42_110]|uniref:ISXO2-like transposase domain-containing protein n=1 Tax=Spraguea lophii (strain 42_110) TaxID=1358809 RepID=S7XR63_SPRLO|nr:hypothetical protein SLOPH_1148 [Spraguea lophii 42_110]